MYCYMHVLVIFVLFEYHRTGQNSFGSLVAKVCLVTLGIVSFIWIFYDCKGLAPLQSLSISFKDCGALSFNTLNTRVTGTMTRTLITEMAV